MKRLALLLIFLWVADPARAADDGIDAFYNGCFPWFDYIIYRYFFTCSIVFIMHIRLIVTKMK
jgi:hypothetical protein